MKNLYILLKMLYTVITICNTDFLVNKTIKNNYPATNPISQGIMIDYSTTLISRCLNEFHPTSATLLFCFVN